MESVTVGLCIDCRHARIMRSDREAVYYRCSLAATDPRFPKYPRLPVLNCPGYEPSQPDDAGQGGFPGRR